MTTTSTTLLSNATSASATMNSNASSQPQSQTEPAFFGSTYAYASTTARPYEGSSFAETSLTMHNDNPVPEGLDSYVDVPATAASSSHFTLPAGNQPSTIPSSIPSTASYPSASTGSMPSQLAPISSSTSKSAISKPNFAMIKRQRVANQYFAGWVGTFTGLLVFGIPGAIIGGVAANKITKAAGKRQERKIRGEYEQAVAQVQENRYAATHARPLPTNTATVV